MSKSDGVSKHTTLDNIVHEFVESVAYEHEHQIDHLKDTPCIAAGKVTDFTQNTEPSIVQKNVKTETQFSTESQLLEETHTKSRFSDFGFFLPERSTLTESAKSYLIDSYEFATETLSVVRVPPKSKRLFSAALVVANAAHRSVNSLASDSGSTDSLSVKETKQLTLPIGFNETVTACAPTAVNNLKKQKKSRGTSRLNAVLKENTAEDTFDHQLKMLQRRLDRISPNKMHKCRESRSGCSVDDPFMYGNCANTKYSDLLVRDNLNNIIDLENLNTKFSESCVVNEIYDDDESDNEVEISNENFLIEEEDNTISENLIETKITEAKPIPQKTKNKRKVFPTSLFRKTIHTQIDAEIEKRERFMKEYLRVASLECPTVNVVLYCRWNPRLSEACGQTTELIIYTLKAFFTTNSGLHVNWIHSPEETFERLLERGARMKFYKDYPQNVRGVLALSHDASILLKKPRSSLICSLCELLGIRRSELAVLEINEN